MKTLTSVIQNNCERPPCPYDCVESCRHRLWDRARVAEPKPGDPADAAPVAPAVAVDDATHGGSHRGGYTPPSVETILKRVQDYDGWGLTNKEVKMLAAEVLRLRIDERRMDWIERQSDGSAWGARRSTTGRGFRLHNTTASVHRTARAAVDDKMALEASHG